MIDWTKPIRMIKTHNPVTLLDRNYKASGNVTLYAIKVTNQKENTDCIYFVDQKGNNYYGNGPLIENTPTKKYIIIYKNNNGKWFSSSFVYHNYNDALLASIPSIPNQIIEIETTL